MKAVHKSLFSFVTVVLAVLAMSSVVWAQEYKHEQTGMKKQKSDHAGMILSSKDIKWTAGPEGLPKGAKMAVMEGDPNGTDLFTVRLKFPANFQIPAHWHPTDEHVTVLSGTFYIGMGDKLSKTEAQEMKMGGFGTVPAQQHHYAFTNAETVIQLHAMGPFKITYVNQDDDPRRRATSERPE